MAKEQKFESEKLYKEGIRRKNNQSAAFSVGVRSKLNFCLKRNEDKEAEMHFKLSLLGHLLNAPK